MVGTCQIVNQTDDTLVGGPFSFERLKLVYEDVV